MVAPVMFILPSEYLHMVYHFSQYKYFSYHLLKSVVITFYQIGILSLDWLLQQLIPTKLLYYYFIWRKDLVHIHFKKQSPTIIRII